MTEELKQLSRELIEEGFTVYHRSGADCYVWVTDGKTVLYVEDNNLLGMHVAYCYVPSTENGAACRVLDQEQEPNKRKIVRLFNDFKEATIETLMRYNGCLSKYGDKRTKTPQRLFKSAEEWKESVWRSDEIHAINNVETDFVKR